MSAPRTHIPVRLVTASEPRATDEELGRALMAGSDWAISETWHRFAPAVTMLAKRALGSRSDAEDIAQEAFHHIFAKAKSLREPERLRSYVFSFVIRTIKSELRSRRARAWLSFHRPETLVELGTELTDVESRDVVRKFYSLLDRLAARPRLVFVLRYVEWMTFDEVAAHMQLSVSTVRRALEAAMSKLSKCVGSDPELAEFLAKFADRRGHDEG